MTSGHTDHLPALSVDPPGVVVLRRHWDGDETWLTIIRADPHVEISDELLTDLAGGGDNNGMYPDVRLQLQPHDTDHCPDREMCPLPAMACYHAALMHIEGRDRTVIYRIGDYVWKRNTWRASWPD